MSSESPDVCTLLMVNSELEATIIADALKDRGFEVEVAGGLTGGFRAETPSRTSRAVG